MVLQRIHQGIHDHHCTDRVVSKEDRGVFPDNEMPNILGHLEREVGKCTILIFLNWTIKFHVHCLRGHTSTTYEGKMDHPIYFSSRKLSKDECNYPTTKREGIAMVYSLQKFRNYMLGEIFKLFTNHYVLK
jgi:hypothetical protein